ncbi:MAG: TrmO family methyltransferase [Pseudopelagicola sp.]|nr:TrmO family methyltransferase [Pseudopelagicola sp.]
MRQDRNATRSSETELGFDPALKDDARLAFVGRIRTSWSRGNCPKNIRLARDTGQGAWIEMDHAYLSALNGLEAGQGMVLIYWMFEARRDLLTQSPDHIDGTRGTFALRSPNRPNPLALSAVTITGIDRTTGRIDIDAIDCFDGTPLVDMKPWLPTIDMPAGESDSP